METLSVKCEKHPELTFTVSTGPANKHEWLQLDEKGRFEVWHKDAVAYEIFMDEVISHFTTCDGQMVRGLHQFID